MLNCGWSEKFTVPRGCVIASKEHLQDVALINTSGERVGQVDGLTWQLAGFLGHPDPNYLPGSAG